MENKQELVVQMFLNKRHLHCPMYCFYSSTCIKNYIYSQVNDGFILAGALCSPTLNAWNHVACVCSSGTVSVYFNRTLLSTTGGYSASPPSTCYMNFGYCSFNNLKNYGVNMYMSDVRLYNRPLSQTEINQIYANTG